jgi:hypothetical protein
MLKCFVQVRIGFQAVDARHSAIQSSALAIWLCGSVIQISARLVGQISLTSRRFPARMSVCSVVYVSIINRHRFSAIRLNKHFNTVDYSLLCGYTTHICNRIIMSHRSFCCVLVTVMLPSVCKFPIFDLYIWIYLQMLLVTAFVSVSDDIYGIVLRGHHI